MILFTSASSFFVIPPIVGVFGPIDVASGLWSSCSTSLRLRKTEVADEAPSGRGGRKTETESMPSTYLNV